MLHCFAYLQCTRLYQLLQFKERSVALALNKQLKHLVHGFGMNEDIIFIHKAPEQTDRKQPSKNIFIMRIQLYKRQCKLKIFKIISTQHDLSVKTNHFLFGLNSNSLICLSIFYIHTTNIIKYLTTL